MKKKILGLMMVLVMMAIAVFAIVSCAPRTFDVEVVGAPQNATLSVRHNSSTLPAGIHEIPTGDTLQITFGANAGFLATLHVGEGAPLMSNIRGSMNAEVEVYEDFRIWVTVTVDNEHNALVSAMQTERNAINLMIEDLAALTTSSALASAVAQVDQRISAWTGMAFQGLNTAGLETERQRIATLQQAEADAEAEAQQALAQARAGAVSRFTARFEYLFDVEDYRYDYEWQTLLTLRQNEINRLNTLSLEVATVFVYADTNWDPFHAVLTAEEVANADVNAIIALAIVRLETEFAERFVQEDFRSADWTALDELLEGYRELLREMTASEATAFDAVEDVDWTLFNAIPTSSQRLAAENQDLAQTAVNTLIAALLGYDAEAITTANANLTTRLATYGVVAGNLNTGTFENVADLQASVPARVSALNNTDALQYAIDSLRDIVASANETPPASNVTVVAISNRVSLLNEALLPNNILVNRLVWGPVATDTEASLRAEATLAISRINHITTANDAIVAVAYAIENATNISQLTQALESLITFLAPTTFTDADLNWGDFDDRADLIFAVGIQQTILGNIALAREAVLDLYDAIDVLTEMLELRALITAVEDAMELDGVNKTALNLPTNFSFATIEALLYAAEYWYDHLYSLNPGSLAQLAVDNLISALLAPRVLVAVELSLAGLISAMDNLESYPVPTVPAPHLTVEALITYAEGAIATLQMQAEVQTRNDMISELSNHTTIVALRNAIDAITSRPWAGLVLVGVNTADLTTQQTRLATLVANTDAVQTVIEEITLAIGATSTATIAQINSLIENLDTALGVNPIDLTYLNWGTGRYGRNDLVSSAELRIEYLRRQAMIVERNAINALVAALTNIVATGTINELETAIQEIDRRVNEWNDPEVGNIQLDSYLNSIPLIYRRLIGMHQVTINNRDSDIAELTFHSFHVLENNQTRVRYANYIEIWWVFPSGLNANHFRVSIYGITGAENSHYVDTLQPNRFIIRVYTQITINVAITALTVNVTLCTDDDYYITDVDDMSDVTFAITGASTFAELLLPQHGITHIVNNTLARRMIGWAVEGSIVVLTANITLDWFMAFLPEGVTNSRNVTLTRVWADCLVAPTGTETRAFIIATEDDLHGENNLIAGYSRWRIAGGATNELRSNNRTGVWFRLAENSDIAFNNSIRNIGATRNYYSPGDAPIVFRGIFDGNRQTIIRDVSRNSVYTGWHSIGDAAMPERGHLASLFGEIAEGAIVRNLNVDLTASRTLNSTQGNTHATRDFGGIAAINRGTIRDVEILEGSTITMNSYRYVGGVAGRNFGRIYDAVNHADVRVFRVGAHEGRQAHYSSIVGGIAGWSSNRIERARNTGDIQASTVYGGIVGFATATANVLYVQNEGEIQWEGSVPSGDGRTVGGIAGISEGNIRYAANIGHVNTNDQSGGIVARQNGETGIISNTFNVTSLSLNARLIHHGESIDVRNSVTPNGINRFGNLLPTSTNNRVVVGASDGAIAAYIAINYPALLEILNTGRGASPAFGWCDEREMIALIVFGAEPVVSYGVGLTVTPLGAVTPSYTLTLNNQPFDRLTQRVQVGDELVISWLPIEWHLVELRIGGAATAPIYIPDGTFEHRIVITSGYLDLRLDVVIDPETPGPTVEIVPIMDTFTGQLLPVHFTVTELTGADTVVNAHITRPGETTPTLRQNVESGFSFPVGDVDGRVTIRIEATARGLTSYDEIYFYISTRETVINVQANPSFGFMVRRDTATGQNVGTGTNINIPYETEYLFASWTIDAPNGTYRVQLFIDESAVAVHDADNGTVSYFRFAPVDNMTIRLVVTPRFVTLTFVAYGGRGLVETGTEAGVATLVLPVAFEQNATVTAVGNEGFRFLEWRYSTPTGTLSEITTATRTDEDNVENRRIYAIFVETMRIYFYNGQLNFATPRIHAYNRSGVIDSASFTGVGLITNSEMNVSTTRQGWFYYDLPVEFVVGHGVELRFSATSFGSSWGADTISHGWLPFAEIDHNTPRFYAFATGRRCLFTNVVAYGSATGAGVRSLGSLAMPRITNIRFNNNGNAHFEAPRIHAYVTGASQTGNMGDGPLMRADTSNPGWFYFPLAIWNLASHTFNMIITGMDGANVVQANLMRHLAIGVDISLEFRDGHYLALFHHEEPAPTTTRVWFYVGRLSHWYGNYGLARATGPLIAAYVHGEGIGAIYQGWNGRRVVSRHENTNWAYIVIETHMSFNIMFTRGQLNYPNDVTRGTPWDQTISLITHSFASDVFVSIIPGRTNYQGNPARGLYQIEFTPSNIQLPIHN